MLRKRLSPRRTIGVNTGPINAATYQQTRLHGELPSSDRKLPASRRTKTRHSKKPWRAKMVILISSSAIDLLGRQLGDEEDFPAP
jgi:hypothetical protein